MRVDYATLIPALKHLLPEEDLDDLGRAVAFIKRLREVTASWFVWAVVLSRFGYGRPGFEQARDWYTTLTGITVWPRPFQMRFKQVEAVRLFRRAFDQAVTRWWDVPGRQHPLARRFADVVVVDSTVMQISDALRSVCWGTRLSAAELKLLVTMSVFGSLPLAADVVPGYQHDMTLFPPMARFRRDTLLLFDKDSSRTKGCVRSAPRRCTIYVRCGSMAIHESWPFTAHRCTHGGPSKRTPTGSGFVTCCLPQNESAPRGISR